MDNRDSGDAHVPTVGAFVAQAACGKPVRCVDNQRLPCVRDEGHIGGCNPFSSNVPVTPCDEVPVFAVKASDPFACAVIQVWINIAESYRKQDGVRPVPAAKIAGARERLREFRNWQEKCGTKIPD